MIFRTDKTIATQNIDGDSRKEAGIQALCKDGTQTATHFIMGAFTQEELMFLQLEANMGLVEGWSYA